jgi:serine/threonine-protein kinase
MSSPQLAVAREKLGRVLKDRWTLEGILGVGGMAAVYLARHRNGMRAAIKLLHGPLSEDTVVRERFLREAYLANSLETKGVVHVLDDDADPALGPFLVMELLEGESVLDLLERGARLPIEKTLDLADQTLDVLAIAHERNVVHRDLKPANLFLCADGTVKVLDFGIARILDDNAARLTRTGVPIGTPAYMAPEQARGQGRDVDGRADIYALGATLFRVVAGRHVHVGMGAAQIALVATTRATKLRDLGIALDPNVAAIIDRAVEFESDRRYASARDMQRDVRAVRAGKPPPIASVPLPPPAAVPKLGFAMPASATAKKADPRRDVVIKLADEARQRAHEAAKRPDAFRAIIGETTRTVNVEATTDPGARSGSHDAPTPAVTPALTPEMDEDDEDLPTLVGSIRPDNLGRRPEIMPEPSPTPPAQKPGMHPPRMPPRSSARTGPAAVHEAPTSPRGVPHDVLAGEQPTVVRGPTSSARAQATPTPSTRPPPVSSGRAPPPPSSSPRTQPTASSPPRTQVSASSPASSPRRPQPSAPSPRTQPSGAPPAPPALSRPASLPPPVAAAFARSPNVPIPSVRSEPPPPDDDDRAYQTDQAYGEDMTTLSRSLKVEQLGHQLYRAVEPPPPSGPNSASAVSMAAAGAPPSMPASSGWPNAEVPTRVPSTERAVIDSPIDPLAPAAASAESAKRGMPAWVWVAIGLTVFGAVGGAIAAFMLR